ncbi:MAG: C25 family cysteine peptidase, partial [Rudaea sp.]
VPGIHARLKELQAPQSGRAASLQRRLHFERENLMTRLGSDQMKPGEEPDFWQWAKLTPIDPKPFEYDFGLPDLNPRASANAILRLDLRGVSTIGVQPNPALHLPDHALEVRLNGKLVQTLTWDGREEIRRDLTVPAGLLREKENRLQLAVPRRALPGNPDGFIVDVVMFNWMEADYAIRDNLAKDAAAFSSVGDGAIEFSFAGPGTPELFGSDGSVRMTAALGKGRYRAARTPENVDLYTALGGAGRAPAVVRAVASVDLRHAEPGYDYLIVAYPSLLAGIRPLADYHRKQGLRVDAVDVDDVYDAFNGGIPHPSAIRDFVAWGREHWSVKPQFLLLVGDASSAIHHDQRDGALSGASYQLSPQPTAGEVLGGQGFAGMTTYGYAAGVPRSRNLVPTWQFPTAEGQGASDNAYADPAPGDFHPRVAVGRLPVVNEAELKSVVDKIIAYRTRPAQGAWRRDVTFISTSEVASFKQESDKLAAELNAKGFVSRSIYTDFNDKNKEHYEQARTTLRENLDRGNLLVHFLGHGGSYIWRVGPMGDLFSLDDVSDLTNAGRYPMVLAMTCFSAPFDNPSDDSIGVRFLRVADKGAVAVFAASWKNSPNPQYSKWLIDELLKPGKRIGSAIVAAKAKIADRDFVETYNLLGDPALILDRPQGQLQVSVARSRWRTQVLVRVPVSDFGGDVNVDWIDKDGGIVASRHYQARDRQFALDLVPGAVLASIYVADGRNGFTAAGSVSLLPPPAPKPKAQPRQAMANVPPRPRTPRTPDTISRLGFETEDVAH